MAAVLSGRKVHAEVELVIVPGSRQSYETAVRGGSLATLIAAGAHVLEGGAPEIPFATGGAGNVLAFGEPAVEAAGRERGYVASPATCAAAALSGHLVDPRELPCEFTRDLEPETYVPQPRAILAPLADAPEAAAKVDGAIPLGRPLEGPLRGMVLARLGDHVRTDQMLPWGRALSPWPRTCRASRSMPSRRSMPTGRARAPARRRLPRRGARIRCRRASASRRH